MINHSACMPLILKKSLGPQISGLVEELAASARALVFLEVLLVSIDVKFKSELKSVGSVLLSAAMLDVFNIVDISI